MAGSPLILGLAAGFHYNDLRPFVTSLRRTGYDGECVLFVSPTTTDRERIQAQGVRCMPFQRPPELAHVPYNAFRYFLYRDYLNRRHATKGPVLLTDTRDVVFQRDPFSFSWAQGLNVTLEDQSVRVRDCPYMRRWIRHQLGEGILLRLAPCAISCSGTTLGDTESVRNYLEQMTRLLLPFTPGRGVAGYDQAVHNYLLHTGKLGTSTTYDNAGPVLTLGYKQEAPRMNAQGAVLNDSGEPAVIIHQYDRHMELFQLVRERY